MKKQLPGFLEYTYPILTTAVTKRALQARISLVTTTRTIRALTALRRGSRLAGPKARLAALSTVGSGGSAPVVLRAAGAVRGARAGEPAERGTAAARLADGFAGGGGESREGKEDEGTHREISSY